jgi:hypothetical protein
MPKKKESNNVLVFEEDENIIEDEDMRMSAP